MSTVWIGNREFDSAEINRRISQAAAGFQTLGVVPGDCVALCLRNDISFFEAGMGAGQIGAFPVAVNWHYTLDEFRYLMFDSGAKVLVIHADLLAPLRAAVPDGVTVIVVPVPDEILSAYRLVDEVARMPEGILNWETWRESCGTHGVPPTDIPSTIIYTSGTTGRPKGVKRATPTPEQSAAFAAMLARSYGFAELLDRPSEIVTAIVGPIYHAAPNAHANFSFKTGANIVVTPRFDPEDLLRLIEKHRITHLNMVPIMFNRLLKLPDDVRAKYDLSSLRFVAHAAAPCAPDVKRAMIGWWGPIINEYYGATETGNVTFCTSAEWLVHPGTVGRITPDAEIRILDAAGQEVPRGTAGVVATRIRGLTDFTYHGDDVKRRAAEIGGLITPGDIGYLDDEGFLFLCDRANDMIISGGVNIYPAEIEAHLHGMPGLADCAVFGVPDAEYGESICAVVQPQPGAALTEVDVLNFLTGKIASYKMPRRVEFKFELPREDSGKIFKRKLRQPFWESAGRSI
jgi:long-chain acyl-CoA synthetase